MKYFIVIAVTIITVCGAIIAYLLTNPGIIKPLSSASEEMKRQQAIDDESAFAAYFNKTQNDIAEIKKIIGEQSIFMQKMQEELLADSARIHSLEDTINDALTNVQTFLTENKESPNPVLPPIEPAESDLEETDLTDSAISPTLTPGMFKDPEFDKEFQSKIAEVVKNIQTKQKQDQLKKLNKQLQQVINKNVEDFFRKQYLNEYQKQEINKALTERNNKVVDLFSMLQDQKITRNTFIARRNIYKNESNNKIKDILLAPQYEQYQKLEPVLQKTMMEILKQDVPP